MSKTRIMLVDDHAVLRAGLRALLDKQPDLEVVAEASTAAEALAGAARNQPDIIVLDLTLPGGGSLDLLGKLRAPANAPRILVLTMHDDPAYARAALAAGATGYVVKTISEQDLLAAMRSVQRGRLIVDLDDETKTASVLGQSVMGMSGISAGKLSDRETEVLKLLGQGHTNQTVAEILDISPKTVATYRARIGEKLGLKSTADFVKYASNTGLLAKPDPPT